jgi:hypothetical protein
MAPPEIIHGRCPLPDLADVLFCLVMGLLLSLMPTYVLADGSTGWHILTGQYILAHGQIPHTDLFSYTFPNRAWVPYEWFADLCAGILNNLGGIKMVAAATGCAIALMCALLYHQCRKEGCHILLTSFLMMLAIFTSTIHWLARPHIFTFFGVMIFSQALESFRRSQLTPTKLLLILFITMIIWSNAHPAFLTGLVLIVIYLASDMAIWLLAQPGEGKFAAGKRICTLSVVLISTVAATFINANAAHLYSYIFQYLGRTAVLTRTDEFMPPDFTSLHAICLLVILFLYVLGLLLSRRKPGLAPFLTVVAFTYLALTGRRNEPLFIVVCLPHVAWLFAQCDPAFLLGSANAKLNTAGWFGKLSAWWCGLYRMDAAEAACNMHILPIAAVIIVFAACLNGGNLFGFPIVTSDFDETSKPTATLKAMMELPEKGGFNLDNWGGYIAYKTGRRVFIDDRLDFYGQERFIKYGRIIQIDSDWRKLLDEFGINWVLMPHNSAMALSLATSPGWEVRAKDKASILVVRKVPLPTNQRDSR